MPKWLELTNSSSAFKIAEKFSLNFRMLLYLLVHVVSLSIGKLGNNTFRLELSRKYATIDLMVLVVFLIV